MPATDLIPAQLLQVALAAARAGSEQILAAAPTKRGEAVVKGRGDYVTLVDRASEAAILKVLDAESGIPVLAEESGGNLDQDLLWVVDPLDGTTNFLHGLPAVGVSIALVREGVPQLGVTLAPFLGLEFRATRGGGAFLNGERVRVSSREPGSALVGTGFPFRLPEQRPRYLQAFSAAMHEFEDLRRIGAASLDLAWTAGGVLDGFFELGLMPWDVAAGGLLVREAGGLVQDWNGGDDWLRSGNIVAGPALVVDRLGSMIRAHS